MDLRYTELVDDKYGITIKVDNVLFSGHSKFQKVDVLESQSHGCILTLDNLMMLTERDEFYYHEMIAHVPLISHRKPESILVIGGGDGGTVREVLKHSTVKKVVLCEIDEMVVDVSKKYLPSVSCGLEDSKVEVVIDDAIEFIKDKKSCYDVILIDSTDPMGPGEGLFTEEFYTNVKEALTPGGIMAAQSESPFANKREMKMMYKLLKKVFHITRAFIGPVPTYPGGNWSWAFCSKDIKPLDYMDEKRASAITKSCRLYNMDIHKACFALPNFIKNELI